MTHLKHFLLVLSVLVPLSLCCGQASYIPVSSKLASRTLMLTSDHGAHSGTAFVIAYNGKHLVVTAKHLFPETSKETEVGVMTTKGWSFAKQTVWYSPNQDLAILPDLPLPPTPNHDGDVKLCEGQLGLNQDFIFLGFPLGQKSPTDGTAFSETGIPLIKSASLAGMVFVEPGVRIYLLDGMNVHGVSGGPLLTKIDAGPGICLAGVISGYESDPVHLLNDAGQESVLVVPAKSELVIAVPFGEVEKLIAEHTSATH